MRLLLPLLLVVVLVGCDNETTSDSAVSGQKAGADDQNEDVVTDKPKKINTDLFIELHESLTASFELDFKDTIPGHRYAIPGVYSDTVGYRIAGISSLEDAARKLDPLLKEFSKKHSASYSKNTFLPRETCTFQVVRSTSDCYIINISLFKTDGRQLIMFISSHATRI